MRVHGRPVFTVVCGLPAIVILATVPVLGAAQGEFPFTRERGRAVVEFQDKQVHIVVAYDYSQRNHDSRWLMIQGAFSSTKPMTIHRNGIALRSSDEREIPMATQRRFGEDVERVRQLLQNAATTRHDVASYFSQRDRLENIQLFTVPFGGVVHDDFVLDNDRVAAGDLFFEAPTGRWDDGTFKLVVRYAGGQAELPIRLE